MMVPDDETLEIKALWFHLVQAFGKSVAAGAFLNISEQRVRWLYNTNNDDIPSLRQIRVLERAIKQPIVTGGLADSTDADRHGKDPMQEAAEAVENVVNVMHLVRTGASKKQVEAASIRAIRELQDVPASLPDDEDLAGAA